MSSNDVWFDDSAQGYAASALGPLFVREVLGWYPVSYYGVKHDVKFTTVVTTSGSALMPQALAPPSVFGSLSPDDVGKRAVVLGAGTVIGTATDGAMSVAVPFQLNILTSASASFDASYIGRIITVTGAGSAGATLTSKVWGVISATQLRLTSNAVTTVSGATYTISDDLYGEILDATISSITLDTVAGTSIARARVYVSTDESTAIAEAIADAVADSPRSTQALPPTIYFGGPVGIGSTMEINEALGGGHARVRLLGSGLKGMARNLATGTTVVVGLNPKMTYLRSVNGGALGDAGLGIRGNITAATKTLTDPDGAFTAADIGKSIEVVGAGTQVGSSTQISLKTTIQFVDSATQVRLTAAAVTTVTEAIYSYIGVGSIGVADQISIERMHFLGAAGQKCGIHVIAANSYKLQDVTCSDFLSGVGHLAIGGGTTNTQLIEINSSSFNCNRIGAKIHDANDVAFTGFTFADGNNNLVGVVPGPGTIGLDVDGMRCTSGSTIQAYETGFRMDGGTSDGRVNIAAMNFEACVTEMQLGGNNATATNAAGEGCGSVISISSHSTSGVGGATCSGLKLLPGALRTEYTPGYYIPTNINMYGNSDAAALLTTNCHDPWITRSQTIAFAASITPDLAIGTTVNITLTGATTNILPPTNITGDIVLTFNFLQDGSGGRAVTWDSIFKLVWTPAAAANKIDSISFRYNGTNWIQVGGLGV